jgi:Tol biopolymer transport system component
VWVVLLVGSDTQSPTRPPELSKLQDFAGKENLAFLVFEWGGQVHYVQGDTVRLVFRLAPEGASLSHHAYPTFSPDGKYIALVRPAGAGGEIIARYDLAAGTLSDVHRWHGTVYGLSWSPTGSQIAFVAKDSDSRSLLGILDTKSGHTDRFLPHDLEVQGGISIDSPPSWSPDGQKIAFEIDQQAGGPYKKAIGIIDLTSQKASLLAEGESPSWSPNGNVIAFYDLKKRTVFTIKPDGSGKKRLFSPYSLLGGATWPGGLALPLLWSADEPIVGYNEITGEGPAYSFSIRNLENGNRQRAYSNSRLTVVAWRKVQNRE